MSAGRTQYSRYSRYSKAVLIIAAAVPPFAMQPAGRHYPPGPKQVSVCVSVSAALNIEH
jgi:hypothetical protein